MEFFGELYEESQLHFHEEKVFWYSKTLDKPESHLGESNHNSNRNWQINQPLFDGRGKWRGELNQEELKKITTILGPIAKSFGYLMESF